MDKLKKVLQNLEEQGKIKVNNYPKEIKPMRCIYSSKFDCDIVECEAHPITKKQLIEKLKEIKKYDGDAEVAHVRADGALLEFINDKEISELFDSIDKYYA